MAAELTREDLRRLARLGAVRRLEQIRQEEAAIRAAFPDLKDDDFTRPRGGRRPGRPTAASAAASAGRASTRRKRRRRKMSAAEKLAVSERMKKYWAKRRKAR